MQGGDKTNFGVASVNNNSSAPQTTPAPPTYGTTAYRPQPPTVLPAGINPTQLPATPVVSRTSANQSPAISADVGDIILTPESPKSNNHPKIFLIILVAIILIAGVVFAVHQMINGSIDNKNNNAISSKWVAYYNYLMTGQEENNASEASDEVTILAEWYPTKLNDLDLPPNEYDESKDVFYSKLRTLFNNYYENGGKEIKESNAYAAFLQSFINYETINRIEDELYEIYRQKGMEAARDAISELTANEEESESETAPHVSVLNTLINNYLNLNLIEMQLHSEDGCIRVKALQWECENDNQDENLLKIEEELDRAKRNMDNSYKNVIEKAFYSDTQELDKMIRSKDD